MVRPDKDFLYHHYETIGTMITRHGKDIFDITLNMMTKMPIIAIVLE